MYNTISAPRGYRNSVVGSVLALYKGNYIVEISGHSHKNKKKNHGSVVARTHTNTHTEYSTWC